MKTLQLLIVGLLLNIAAYSQSNIKNDVILQRNGDELTGKVVEIDDDIIKFIHVGETLIYKIKKLDISKISYASGRIEIYNNSNVPLSQSSSGSISNSNGLSNYHNKIAILPFDFVKDGEKASEELGTIVQAACFSYLQKHAHTMSVLDTRNTNAILIKAGVTRENLEGYTMDDICNILGVEYVVDGRVQLNETSESSSASNFYSNRGKKEDKELRKNGFATASTNTRVNYATVITVDIYSEKGNNIYNNSRKSFSRSQDAYKTTLEHLLKRSPLFRK